MESQSNAAGTIIQQLNPNDVLCGRGSGPNDYSGNIKFRALVMDRRDEYLSTSNRASKAKVAREIVDYVKCMNPPGRFLEQVENNKNTPLWRIVTEEKALEKAKQALRQNRHRRGGAGSMGSSSFAMISPSPSMGSNCDQKSPPPRMNGHYRSYSYTAGHRNTQQQHTRSQSLVHNYIPNNHSMPIMQPHSHYNYASPPPIGRAMSAEASHNRSRSDHAFNGYAPHPDQRHHRSYSERHYNYYRPPPPPHDYYQYPEEPQQQYVQSQIDRKYFNNYGDQLKSDEDSIVNEEYDIMPDPVPSVNKRSRNFDTMSPTNINVFDQNDFSTPNRSRMEPNEYFKPKRNRMFSADSDISAIELELDSATNTTKVILPPTSPTDSMSIFSNNDNEEVVVKELVKEEDPLSISDIPESNGTTGHHKRSFDVNPNEMLKDFDMSYYVLQTLGDDIHDL